MSREWEELLRWAEGRRREAEAEVSRSDEEEAFNYGQEMAFEEMLRKMERPFEDPVRP